MLAIPGTQSLWNALQGVASRLSHGGAPRTYPTLSGMFPDPGTVASYPSPTLPRWSVDEVLQQVWPQPWYGSGDLDPIQGDSPENRACYLALYKKEPRLNAAIEGKVASVSTLKVSVRGANEENPQDVEAADFIQAAIQTSVHGSWITLLASILRPGFVYGWSAGEIKLRPIQRGEHRGKWGLEHVRNLNTEPFIKLQLDVYRNITGVVNLIRGIQDFSPEKFVFYVNKPIFSNPFGQSDIQPAQRAAMLFREVYQVWYIALKRYGLPYMHGQVSNPNYRKALEQAMDDLQGSGWAVTGIEDKITVLNLAAAASASGFEAMIDKNSEDIFFAVRGSATPSQVSSNKGGDNRGDTKESRQTGQDPIEKMAAEEACRSINQWLVPVLMEYNYPPSVGMPIVTIGESDEDDTKTRLDIIDIVENKLKRPCSTEEIFKIANVKPADPSNPDDAKIIAQAQAINSPLGAKETVRETDPNAAPGQPPKALPPGGAKPPAQPLAAPKATPVAAKSTPAAPASEPADIDAEVRNAIANWNSAV